MAKSKYKTGFCTSGFHEGQRPKVKGRPVKVCELYETCACSCHDLMDKFAELNGMPRIPMQNPEYVPYNSGIMEFIETYRDSDLEPKILGIKSEPVEVALAEAPVLSVSTRLFEPTTRGRAPGQLEEEVREVCNKSMMGLFDEQLTPKFIAQVIDPEAPPSVGAIGAIFDRWKRIGFAQIETKPVRFVSYTAQGLTLGLNQLKINAKNSTRTLRSARR